jgi:23S rRNA pseudouridine1911/1915/1917 synthase
MELPDRTPPLEEWLDFESTPDDSGKRLDKFLADRLPDISRSRIQKNIDEGRCFVNGKTLKSSARLEGTETIQLCLIKEIHNLPEAESIPLKIVYEDSDLAVIDKPAGMVVHHGAGVRSGTLVNALLHHFQQLPDQGGADRPGIVHRLDKETSGLIIIARNEFSHLTLSRLFQERAIQKKYLALVHGRLELDSDEIIAPISRDRRQRVKMTTRNLKGREAITSYEVMERFSHFTLLRVTIKTGRTHQIRVHLSSIHHPVVGDTLYGAPGRFLLPGSRQVVPTLSRNFLHAAQLKFSHPRTGEPLVFKSKLPEELQEFLEKIRKAVVSG